jgi:hypothetical protein
MPAQTTIDQYNTLAGLHLARDRQLNAPIGAGGGVVNMDAPVGGAETLTVEADMSGAAAGDLGISVFPYEADGVTLQSVSLVPMANVGYVPTLAAPRVVAEQEYDVRGLDKVRVVGKNNNAGAQNINLSWRTY